MKKTIAHSVYPYLFNTGSWIYSQLKGISKYDSLVVTDQLMNTDIFPFGNIINIRDCNKVKSMYMKIYNKLYGNQSPFICKSLKGREVALIHSHFGNIGWQDTYVKTRLNIPQLTTFYGYDISYLPQQDTWKRKYKCLFEVCDLFTVEGKYMKQSLVNMGCNERKVVVQHLGIDLEKVNFLPRKIGNDGMIKFLAAGTFREKKGIHYAVEAFGILMKKYKNIHLTIIGDAKSERELVIKRRILDIIKEYQLEEHVDMLGYMPYELMLKKSEEHHIFISPSVQASDGDNEGGAPVSIIEMSAAGMPVISTRHCDIPNVLIDGKSGLLVDEKDVNALVERMAYLIENSGIWETMGVAGRKYIEEEYNIKKQVILLEGIYDKLLL